MVLPLLLVWFCFPSPSQLPCTVSVEQCAESLRVSLVREQSFFSCCFQSSLFISVFSHFDYYTFENNVWVDHACGSLILLLLENTITELENLSHDLGSFQLLRL